MDERTKYEEIIRLTDEWLGEEGDNDGLSIEGQVGSVTVVRGKEAGDLQENCKAAIAFICTKGGSRKDLCWFAEDACNGESPASMPIVNSRRNVTGSAETLSEMSDPSLEEVLQGIDMAIKERDA